MRHSVQLPVVEATASLESALASMRGSARSAVVYFERRLSYLVRAAAVRKGLAIGKETIVQLPRAAVWTPPRRKAGTQEAWQSSRVRRSLREELLLRAGADYGYAHPGHPPICDRDLAVIDCYKT